ncbi:MAG TPA: hypothetical protein VGD67_26740 [Pseudonocardiaceae bacterium]
MFNVIGGAIGGAVDGIGDAIRRAVADLPGGAVGFRVEPDQVFALANRFDDIADRIQGSVAPEIRRLHVAPPGADKPSRDAADRLRDTAFGDAGLVTRLSAYATQLREAAASLRLTGQQYGLTDTTEGGRLSASSL